MTETKELSTSHWQDTFEKKVLALLPRKDQHLSLDFKAGKAGPAYLEQANASYAYIETLSYQIPVLEGMLFSGQSNPALTWDAGLINRLGQIPYAQFPFELFNKLCPYPEAIPQFQKIAGLIKDKKVLVVGTEFPWLELFCIICGAQTITTVEYRPVTWEGELKINTEFDTITWHDFESNMAQYQAQYDLVLSYSSIEHSGLGRYGDPLMPLGDLYTFMLMGQCLKEDGMCFLAVPVGQDLTHFNAHRIYGPKRIKALEFISDLTLTGLVVPDAPYYDQYEEVEPLKSEGWSFQGLLGLPLGQYRQPLMGFKKIMPREK